jgi:3-dehydroquinate synthase
MKHVDVRLGERSYQVAIGAGLVASAGDWLAPFMRAGRLLVISDETVWAIHGRALAAALGEIEIVSIVIPPGEASKSWPVLIRLIDRLLALGIERGDHLVAFGGGVVGDLTGFAAAILKRGCPWVQIPTSLLAQVDSSVGGKTAINAAAGKNLVGAFHQPAAVFVDVDLLATLPLRHVRAGYAEVVKYGLIGDPDFFAWCEARGSALIGGEREARLYAIETSIRAKAAIVAQDERETSGRRALLNLGHTFGHALEAETGFSERLLHGEAVAAGMALAFRFSAQRGLCGREAAARVTSHLAAAGLPTSLREAGIAARGRALVAHMAQDKKRAGGRLPFILARGIGTVFVDQSIEPAEVEAFLDAEAD